MFLSSLFISFLLCDGKSVKTLKKMILTSKQRANLVELYNTGGRHQKAGKFPELPFLKKKRRKVNKNLTLFFETGTLDRNRTIE